MSVLAAAREAGARRFLPTALDLVGLPYTVVHSAEAAWIVLQDQPVSLLVLDSRLLGAEQLCRCVRARPDRSACRILLIAGPDDVSRPEAWSAIGVDAQVATPISWSDLLAALRRLAPSTVAPPPVGPVDDGVLDTGRRVAHIDASARTLEELSRFVPGLFYQFHVDAAGEGACPFISECVRDFFGLEPEEVYARPGQMFDQIVPEDRATYFQHANEAILLKKPLHVEFRVSHARTGAVRWLNVAAAFRVMPGGGTSWNGVMFDVTELKRTQSELARARLAAEAASRAKSAFLANMSHEIRTPLNAVLGLTSLLLDREDRTDTHRALSTIHDSASHLLSLLGDILDVSRIEAGKLELELAPFEPARLLAAVEELFRSAAERKGLDLNLDARDLPTWVSGDALRVRQIVSNLVGNAIKFTEHGGVRVGARARASGSLTELEVAVEDTGPGIPEELVPRLFEPFSQLDPSMTRRHGGAGLGLSISRQLAALMGGTLHATSRVGAGATFVFRVRLPAVAGDSVATVRPDRPAPRLLTGLPVLVVDDHTVNREVAAMLVERLGLGVEHASDGPTALELTAARRFALVLMDCQMPGMDGLTATRLLRAREVGGDWHQPVVALTAHALHGDRERCLAAGMDDYLAKPVTLVRLAATLGRWLPVGGAALQGSLDPGLGDLDASLDPSVLSDLEPAARRRVIQLFLADVPPRLAALRQASTAGPPEVLLRESHVLKGASGLLHAAYMSSLCDRLYAAAEREALEESAGLVLELSHEFERVARSLASSGA